MKRTSDYLLAIAVTLLAVLMMAYFKFKPKSEGHSVLGSSYFEAADNITKADTVQISSPFMISQEESGIQNDTGIHSGTLSEK